MKAETKNNILKIWLEGEIDAQNAPAIRDEIMRLLESGTFDNVVFDAEKLSYISSAGLRAILAAQKKIQKKVAVAKLQPGMLEIFQIAGFQHIMDIEGA